MPNAPAGPLVVAIAYDRLCTFEFGCIVEVFGLARPEMGPHWYRFAVAAAAPGPLRGLGGLRIEPDGGLELLERAATVIVPGWPGPDVPVPPPLVRALQAAHARGARLVSVCVGAFVLAAAGLLSGRRATAHWRHAQELARRYPQIDVRPDVLYVDEGSILTSAGSAAGLDLCLYLVRKDFGARAANQVARRLVIPAHRDGGQAQYVERPVPFRPGAGLAILLDRVRNALAEPWPMQRLAAEAGSSTRSIHRRFREATGMAPGEWLLNERISRARALLEETGLPVEAIALQVGFGAGATLRNHFRKSLGVTPRAYRARFTVSETQHGARRVLSETALDAHGWQR